MSNDQVTGLLQCLRDGIEELGSSDGWAGFLDIAGRHPALEFWNVVALMAQRPEATRLVSYRGWQGLGRQVRRGERSIRLLAPIDGDHMVDLDALRDPAAGRRCQLKATSVFDIAQTDDIPLSERRERGGWSPGQGGPGFGCESFREGPPFGDRLGRLAPELLLHHQLAALVRAEGYRFVLGPLPSRCPSEAQGSVHFGARTVMVRGDLPAGQRAKTTAHVLTHVLMHAPGSPDRRSGSPVPGRARREMEAESVAYVVTTAHGVHADAYTLTGLPGDDIATACDVAQRVHRGARTILQRLGATDAPARRRAA